MRILDVLIGPIQSATPADRQIEKGGKFFSALSMIQKSSRSTRQLQA